MGEWWQVLHGYFGALPNSLEGRKVNHRVESAKEGLHRVAVAKTRRSITAHETLEVHARHHLLQSKGHRHKYVHESQSASPRYHCACLVGGAGLAWRGHLGL